MADPRERNDAAEAAIAQVLAAERDARTAVERAKGEVHRIAEDARIAVRSVSERTERRVRCVIAAFERDLAARLAEVDAEAAKLEEAQPIGADERAELQRAVAALARQIIGARP